MATESKSQPDDVERILCASEEVTSLPGSSKRNFQGFPCGDLDLGRDVDLLNYDFGGWPLSDSADISSIVQTKFSRRALSSSQRHLAPHPKTSARRHKDSQVRVSAQPTILPVPGVDADTPDSKGIKKLAELLRDAQLRRCTRGREHHQTTATKV